VTKEEAWAIGIWPCGRRVRTVNSGLLLAGEVSASVSILGLLFAGMPASVSTLGMFIAGMPTSASALELPITATGLASCFFV